MISFIYSSLSFLICRMVKITTNSQGGVRMKWPDSTILQSKVIVYYYQLLPSP